MHNSARIWVNSSRFAALRFRHSATMALMGRRGAPDAASHVPAATRAMKVLRFLATQPEPVTLDHVSRAVGIPRSSAYHLVKAMIAEGFVVHLEDERRYGLGASAFEVGSGFTRQAPLQRLARRPLAELVDSLGQSCHLAVLHGRDVLYVLEERAPRRPSLVSDVGVRLPAQLTASGRAILASLPSAQVRALFPDRSAFVTRHDARPTTLSALTALLGETRRRGFAREDGEVTPGMSSLALAMPDHVGYPVAAVAVTFESGTELVTEQVVERMARTVHLVSGRLGRSGAEDAVSQARARFVTSSRPAQ